VEIAHNGSEAIEKATHARPEIIILDIGLPDMDGYEVARILQAQKNFSSALIALTGYGQPGDKERALKAGFRLHLTKPVSLKEIEAALRKISRV
jgi:CheY-like chemotaxis protein